MPIAKLERLLKPITRATTLPPMVLTVRAVGRVNGAAISDAFGCEYGGDGNAVHVRVDYNPWDGVLSLASPNGRRWLCIAQSHTWAEERDIVDSVPVIQYRGPMYGFEVVEIRPTGSMFSHIAPAIMFISECRGSDRLVQSIKLDNPTNEQWSLRSRSTN